MSKEKEEAKEALSQLRTILNEALQNNTDAQGWGLRYLDKCERYIGELRREKSAAREAASLAESKVASLHRLLAEQTKELDELRETAAKQRGELYRLQRPVPGCPEGYLPLPLSGETHALVPGVAQPSHTPSERKRLIKQLRKDVQKYLPNFAKGISEQMDVMTVHQDAFAADYHRDEFTLLGMAVKYAGLHGVTVMITGTNGSTLKKP